MSQKKLLLILLGSTLLSFNYFIKTMENPNKKRKIINEQCEDEPSDLKQIEFLKSINEHCINKHCINKHCTLLKKLCSFEQLKINEENLNKYKKLLYEMFRQQHPDFNLILSIFDNHFKIMLECYQPNNVCYRGISLEHINILLNILIKQHAVKEEDHLENTLQQEKYDVIKEIIYYCFRGYVSKEYQERLKKNYMRLCRLLLENNLLPTLDEDWFLYWLIYYCDDIGLFRDIINKKIEGNLDLSEFACILDQLIEHGCKDQIKFILKFIKKNGFNLNDFIINASDNNYTTILDIAAENREDEIVSLLMNGDEEINSLKHLSALQYLQKERAQAKAEGKNILDIIDANEKLPEEMKEYCKELILDEHYALLDWLGNTRYNLCDKQDLNKYKTLLKQMGMKHPDFNFVVSLFDDYFKLVYTYYDKGEDDEKLFRGAFYDGIGITNINVLLKVLVNGINPVENGFYEILNGKNECLYGLINYVLFGGCLGEYEDTLDEFKCNRISLLKFLIVKNLLPALDTETGDTAFVEQLVKSDLFDSELLYYIMDKGNKKCNWEHIFKECSNENTLLHEALCSYRCSQDKVKDKVKAILNLIKAKNLYIDDFINIQNGKGRTPLMFAASKGYYKIMKLLIEYGAKVDIRCKDGKTASDYMKEYKG